eukprot:5941113-Pleurochrysis_carterae.AAC.1
MFLYLLTGSVVDEVDAVEQSSAVNLGSCGTEACKRSMRPAAHKFLAAAGRQAAAIGAMVCGGGGDASAEIVAVGNGITTRTKRQKNKNLTLNFPPRAPAVRGDNMFYCVKGL